MPSDMEGTMRSDVGSAGINEPSLISCLITIWLGRGRASSRKASLAAPRSDDRSDRLSLQRSQVRVGLVARRGHSLVGMAVVDPDGLEIGYVASEEPNVLVLGEGSSGRMRLGRRYVRGVADRITLSGPVAQIFVGLNVIDSDGEFVGIVRDTMETEDVLDAFIVEDEAGEMVNVLLEDVRAIDEWVELSVSGDSLYEKN